MSQSSARRASGRDTRRQRQQQKPNIWLIVGLAVALLIIVVVAVLAIMRATTPQPGQQVDSQNPLGNQHINNLTDPHPTYNSNPPTSGWHYVNPANPGISTQPLPDEQTVHNLEHGFVIIHYRQDLDKATVDQITQLARQLQRQSPCIIVEPRATDKLADAQIALTSWNWLLKLQGFDANAISNFFRAHVGHGAEAVCPPL
jgi:hypothetical protein